MTGCVITPNHVVLCCAKSRYASSRRSVAQAATRRSAAGTGWGPRSCTTTLRSRASAFLPGPATGPHCISRHVCILRRAIDFIQRAFELSQLEAQSDAPARYAAPLADRFTMAAEEHNYTHENDNWRQTVAKERRAANVRAAGRPLRPSLRFGLHLSRERSDVFHGSPPAAIFGSQAGPRDRNVQVIS
jgi:hypothetical protein